MMELNNQDTFEAQRIFMQFFDDNAKYSERIKTLVSKEEVRLIVDLNDLRILSEERVEKLLKNSFAEISACQKALKLCIGNVDVIYSNKHEQFFVGFEGSFGTRHLNPRSLESAHLGNMVCLEGIVTRMSSLKPKLERSVHYCPATNKNSERRYADMTSLEPYPSSGAYPTKDDQGNVLETEFGLCSYKDHQTFTIQEMPEHTPAGQMPRFTEVVLEHDLVDSCKAGDRVYVTGQYRCLPGKKGGLTTAIFRSVVIANNVYPFAKQMSTNFEDIDLKNILEVSKKKDILDLLTRSVAPSICGHEFIKRAILCQILGGVERLLTNGSRIRGDINLLLLGDPSVAKSQFLRFVLQCARDRAIATTGRGSSGVGLTAAVVTDRETGDRTLEAGAMVLADRGIVCIDEFDKMSDLDRTAIHEVMEQGRVTIAKAGIQAKLNARCSVLAAANPVYGRYDQYKTPHDNIGMQDSLLSRFDLLFIVLDHIDEETDRALGAFVFKSHQYRMAGEEDGHAMSLQGVHNVELVGSNDNNNTTNDASNAAAVGQVFENTGDNRIKRYFTKSFFEKYLQVARQLKPKLSKEASKILVDKYCDLRTLDSEMAENGAGADNRHRTQPVTARTLETLIRLATAHAKARMKKVVSKSDAEAAAELVSFVMFKEVLKKSGKRQRPTDDDESGDDAEMDVAGAGDVGEAANEDVDMDNLPAKRLRAEVAVVVEMVEPVAINADQLNKLTKWVSEVFSITHETDLSVAQIMAYIRTQNGGNVALFPESLIREGLDKLHEKNRLMVNEDHVYMI